MAEHASSQSAIFMTLTYGGGYDNPAAYVLDKSHLAQLRVRMARAGLKGRYIAVGEHGTKHGRAHWHLLYFVKGEEPENLVFDRRHIWTYPGKRGPVKVWPHGWAMLERPKSEAAAAAYLLAYLDKGKKDRGSFTFAKRPALGEEYLRGYAIRAAREGRALFPRGRPVYTVTGNVMDKGEQKGEPYEYRLEPNSALFERFVTAYVAEWHSVRPQQVIPWDKYVHGWCYEMSAIERDGQLPDAAAQSIQSVIRATKLGLEPDATLRVHEVGDLRYVLEHDGSGQLLIRQYDEEGNIEWQESRDARGETVESVVKQARRLSGKSSTKEKARYNAKKLGSSPVYRQRRDGDTKRQPPSR